METTPEVMLQWGAAIKIVIDIIAPLIPQAYRKVIPPVALLMWLWRAFAFMWSDVSQMIFYGISIGASAVGINEVTKVLSSK